MLRDELSKCLSVLATPSDVYTDLRSKNPWATPLALNMLAYLVVSVLMHGVFQQMISNIFSARFGEDSAPTLVSRLSAVSFIVILTLQSLTIPIRLLWTSTMIFLIARNMRFRNILLCLVYAEIVLSLMAVSNVLLIYVRGLEKIASYADLHLIPGLQYLIAGAGGDRILFDLANSANIFSVWYIFTIATGLSTMFNISKIKAGAYCCFAWISWSLLVIIWSYIQNVFMPTIEIR
jgi:hypothetical protein